jgi:hypothetical protein
MKYIIAISFTMLAHSALAQTSYQTYSYGNGDSSTYGSNGESYQTYSYGNGDYGTFGSDGSSCMTYGYDNGDASTYCTR